MEIDHVGTVQSSLSSKACQIVIEVDLKHKKPVETLEGKREISCIPHVSAAENVGHFKIMRRECQVKSFDGLGLFSYVCRMMRSSEPNTNEFEPERGSVYSERCVGDQHYICVVNSDQQNPERVRGFPVRLMLKKGKMMQVRTFLMIMIVTVGMFPLHLQSQIRHPIRNKHQRGPRM